MSVDDTLDDRLREVLAGIPYATFLGLRLESRAGEGERVLVMPAGQRVIGNPWLPALHGGTVGALLESAAIVSLMQHARLHHVPKTINLTVDYLRSGQVVDTFASATVTKLGRRVANVQVRAYQHDPGRPIAAAHAHFLVSEGEASAQ